MMVAFNVRATLLKTGACCCVPDAGTQQNTGAPLTGCCCGPQLHKDTWAPNPILTNTAKEN